VKVWFSFFTPFLVVDEAAENKNRGAVKPWRQAATAKRRGAAQAEGAEAIEVGRNRLDFCFAGLITLTTKKRGEKGNPAKEQTDLH
jgi:hypothetical protein